MLCGSASEHTDGSDQRPCGGAFDGFLPVLCEASAPTQPCKGAFDDPAARQNLKALGGVGALDDLDGPFAHAGERAAQFLSGISSIGKDMTQPREAAADRRQHIDGAVTILDIGGMDEDEDQQSRRCR